MLRWHYRSRHQSLIAVSNHEFYDDNLVVFPSPSGALDGLGLRYHHLADTSYGRGGSRANAGEAQAVAEAVMQHAATTPHLTLGVAAFSSTQAQAILDQLERLRRADPRAEAFFADHPTEPFFVKNLENVQGDERDVIFISVGYGKDANGALTLNFGPLNATGGERRLNVLITRARQRCEVFTNLTADDIDLGRTQARGVVALKLFLRYAQTGILDVPLVSDRPSGSPFEDAVANALRGVGYEVDGQVGSAGFFIDLAVKDPAQPGRYLLGVECDGATYHSAQSARDRDRLRQQVLEGLGWRIARVWSTDWFRNPERELRRLATALERAKASGVATPSPSSSAAVPTAIAREALSAPLAPSLPPYTLAAPNVRTGGVELHLIPTATLASWLCAVVDVESPVHRDEACRRVLAAVGVGRMGSRIQQAFNQALLHAIRAGQLRAHDAFLWTPTMTEPPLRDRSHLNGASRDLALIAPEEVELAVARVVRDAYGMETSQIAPAVARLFGFQRLTDDMRAHIDPLVERMVADGRLTRQGGVVAVV
jgi:very-short-patch-repair endonuclease